MIYGPLSPLVAFLAYFALVAVISGVGRMLAPSKETEVKSSTYASGEKSSLVPAAPGYQPFFVVALFFAMLHLGVLVVASGEFTIISGAYIVGLILALFALILG